MREGENTAQIPEKSTGLFHCHLALQSQNFSGEKSTRHMHQLSTEIKSMKNHEEL